MMLPVDVVLTDHDQFESILADIDHAIPLDVRHDVGESIDDVVSIIAIHRSAIDDRRAWRQIRREVYDRFDSHADIPSRTLAGAIDAIRNELAQLSQKEMASISFDDVPQASSPHYELTTYRQPLTEMANALVDILEGKKRTQKLNAFLGNLIIRLSA